MAGPLLLSDNLFSTVIYSGHVIVAQESAGHEAFHLADGRRSIFDYWTPTTANVDQTVIVTSSRVADPGFESGVGDAIGNLASVAQDAGQHHTGTKSLKVTTTNANGSGAFLSNYPVIAGASYDWTIWVIGPTAVGKTLRLGVDWRDANGTILSSPIQASFSLTASWVEKTYVLTAPNGAVSAGPNIYTDSAEGVFDFFLDDVSFGRSFQPTAAFLDRGHNVGGIAVSYQVSSEGTTYSTVWTATIPGYGATDITAANGCTTEEGAWGKVWSPGTAGSWHRILIPAMGTGRVPVIVGLWLGVAYQPTFLYMPSADDGATFTRPGNTTEWGWRGGGPPVVTRDGTLNLKFDSAADYTTARPFLVKQFAAGRPMWICHDQAQADRTILAMFPDGARIDPRFDSGWFPRQVQIPYQEHEPKRA